jgi:protein SCO1/2
VPTPGDRPAFTLTDTSGQAFDFQRDTAGAVTLLYYGYTHCPDVCPTNMAMIANALKAAGPAVASKVKVVFVTTDPERDTGPVLRDWLDHFDPSFIGLTGTADAINAAMAAEGLPPAEKTPLTGGGYEVTHASWTTVFAQDNKAHLLYGLSVNQAQWVHDLTKLVQQGWSSS